MTDRPHANTLHADPLHSPLFTDLYELTMGQAYLAEGMDQPAVFELFFRRLPRSRNYILAAGLDDVLDCLENFHFTPDDLDYLRRQQLFSEDFLARLGDLRFTGDVFALPEGTPVFPHEPLLQVVAPILEAQLVETVVLNQVHYQSLAATKGARVVTAAAGRAVVEFGARRAHGADAALKAARCSYLAGAVGTSNVVAGQRYGIPIFGTMAHSYIQAHDDEAVAFERFARLYPNTTLLVDTYDTLSGVRRVIELARRMGPAFQVQSLRLDSGNLTELARQTRRMLDEAGLHHVRLFASGGLDEYKLRELLQAGAPIDAFGVGTNLAVCDDAPSLDMAYKLVDYAGVPRLKLSSEKATYPARKQVFRQQTGDGMIRDVIGRFEEDLPGEPLLRRVMRAGQRTDAGRTTLAAARQHAAAALAKLPESLHSLDPAATPFEVQISPALERTRQSILAASATP